MKRMMRKLTMMIILKRYAMKKTLPMPSNFIMIGKNCC